MKIQSNDNPENLMDLIPLRQVQWEEDKETHLVSILKPKFNLASIQKRLKSPFYKVNLDNLGSAIWKNINGRNSVYTIANMLQEIRDEPMKNLYERVGAFIKSLERNRLIRLESTIQEDS